ncbi:diguanylate cyclase [Hoeflea sp. AS60]|uniref:diguanylate cyclase domain-containing protein n=1 Tax=Hoeflea sp. AS60 TaxID=3135780 RepID=UPI003179F71B
MDVTDNGDISKSIVVDLEKIARETLLVDPLTQLVSYDSMANFIKRRLSRKDLDPCFLAIGDVDGLREYVSSCNNASNDMFGHLAGNHCMKLVGKTVAEWQARQDPASVWLSGTFGGDEVIIFSQGGHYSDFINRVRELSCDIARTCPRPCSFAGSEYSPTGTNHDNPEAAYRAWVSRVDRTLFEAKSKRTKIEDEGFVITCSGKP